MRYVLSLLVRKEHLVNRTNQRLVVSRCLYLTNVLLPQRTSRTYLWWMLHAFCIGFFLAGYNLVYLLLLLALAFQC
jgi:hypothetical protein